MKILKAIAAFGMIILATVSIFTLINVFSEKDIFPYYITVPMYLVSLAGIICEMIYSRKKTNEKL